MMKESTLKRINKTVLNYLSLVGLQDGKHLDQDNPILIYFMTNIMMNQHNSLDMNNLGSMEMSDGMPIDIREITDIPTTMNIDPGFFHAMVKEMYNIYDNLEDMTKNQNPEIKEVLTNFIGNEQKFKEYINTIMNQYKEAFYDLVIHYNSYNPDYNLIRMRILNDKMMEYAEEEQYAEAAKLRDRIKIIKERGK
jgi:hypothetical protein